MPTHSSPETLRYQSGPQVSDPTTQEERVGPLLGISRFGTDAKLWDWCICVRLTHHFHFMQWILSDLFVIPEARRNGVGEALMDRARKLAEDTSADALLLETAIDNFAARRLYECRSLCTDANTLQNLARDRISDAFSRRAIHLFTEILYSSVPRHPVGISVQLPAETPLAGGLWSVTAF